MARQSKRVAKPTRTQGVSAQLETPRTPKLRGRAPTDDSDASRVVFVDELWTVEVSRTVSRKRWSWTLSFPSLANGFLWSDDEHASLAAALADVRRVLRRLLGAST